MATENKDIKKGFSRRKFLKRGAIVLGGTIAATYLGRGAIRRYAAQTVENMELMSMISTFKPDFWFEVLPDNTILMKSPKIEMGQGIFTGYAMIAAEELEVSLDQMKVEHANTATGSIDNLTTGGSNSTSSLFTPIREVAATMREMLKAAAAKQWGVNAADVTAQNGILTSGNHKMTYAEVSKTTKDWEVPKTPALKPVSAFKIIGTDVKRIDLKQKVLGKPIFGIDQTFPDMLHAVLIQSPYIGGVYKSIDFKTRLVEAFGEDAGGVNIIQKTGLIAVVAATRYLAEMAAQKIVVEWDVPKQWQQADFEQIVTVGNGSGINIQSVGNAEDVLKTNAAQIFKQEYRTPLGIHAHMEPNGAVAFSEPDKVTIYVGTQAPGMLREKIAKALDLKKSQVTVHVMYSGGAFGRKNDFDLPVKAAYISNIVKKPVSLFNTREQEFQNSLYYRPNTHHVLQAKINADGSIDAIQHDQASPDMVLESFGGDTALNMVGADFISAGHGASILYNSPNKSATLWQNKLPIPTGIWRSVGIFPNTFAIESFFNEMAHKIGKDPIDFRLNLLRGDKEVNERCKKVLETLAEKSGWRTPKAEGIGRGMAITNDRKTIAAAVIEVTVVDNKIQVKKVSHVVDAGLAINPEGIRQQIEGCIMMGISASLYEGVQIKDGQIAAATFAEYPLASLADVPEIQTFILQNSKEVYGIGEPPIGPIAPAIADAIFDLTGKRLRSLPLKLG